MAAEDQLGLQSLLELRLGDAAVVGEDLAEFPGHPFPYMDLEARALWAAGDG